MGINLALGILYTWSVISQNIPADWGWNESDKSWPYSWACLVFCLIMVPAGRMQDALGPRIVAAIGGILVGVGFIVASFTTSLIGFVIGFGVIAGAGLGFGYASCTPPAVKWFSASKTGLIAGLVVSGFGLASVYTAPLTKWLIVSFGFASAMLTLGIAFLILVVGLSLLLVPPPPGFVPPQSAAQAKGQPPAGNKVDYRPREMLRTPQFYTIWFTYACGAGAGLMIISKLAAIADKQIGISLGFMLVAVLAIGNGGGRVLAGMLSDRIGRKATLFICFVLQALLIFLLSKATGQNILGNLWATATMAALIGANYGANLSLFPSLTKDYFGLRFFGTNYGLVFTAWGVGGFLLAKLAGSMYVRFQTFDIAYWGAASLLVIAALVTLPLRAPRPRPIKIPATAPQPVNT